MTKEENTPNGKINGKAANGQNGKTNGQKIIPKDIWKDFATFWDKTDWESLTVADIKNHLGNGKFVFILIPKNVTDKTVGKAWYDQIAQFREKGKGGFSGYTVCFAGQKTTLEQVFGDKTFISTSQNLALDIFKDLYVPRVIQC